MRTRAQAWTIRAAVVAVVTAASVVGISTPAHAAPEIVNFGLSATSIEAGQQVTASWTVLTLEADGEIVDVSVTSNNPQVECSGQCNVAGAKIEPGTGTDFTATFTAKGIFASEQKVKIEVKAGNTRRETQLTIRATPTVPEVRGKVLDLYTAQPVKDARVGMTDSAGTVWSDIGTNEQGEFTIQSTPQKPIAAGPVVFTVTKEGMDDYLSPPFPAQADQPLTNVQLKVTIRPSASATTDEAPPTETSEASASATETLATEAPRDTGLSGFAIMMITVGGLLVLTGIAAIVLLFVRRNNDDNDGPPGYGRPGMTVRGGPAGPGGPGRGGPPPPGPRRPGGPPDRTIPMRPGPGGGPRPGAPGARDQTMIARSPLADAPTQMHGRGAPQPPYSGPPAPPPPQQPGGGYGPPPGGYGQQPGGYGAQQAYGGQPGYGPPPPAGPSGYGPPRPGPGYADPRQGRPAGEGRRVDWMDD